MDFLVCQASEAIETGREYCSELDETQSYSPNTCNFYSSFLKALMKLMGTTINGHFPHSVLQEMNKSHSVYKPGTKHSWLLNVVYIEKVIPIQERHFISEFPPDSYFPEMPCYLLSYNFKIILFFLRTFFDLIFLSNDLHFLYINL